MNCAEAQEGNVASTSHTSHMNCAGAQEGNAASTSHTSHMNCAGAQEGNTANTSHTSHINCTEAQEGNAASTSHTSHMNCAGAQEGNAASTSHTSYINCTEAQEGNAASTSHTSHMNLLSNYLILEREMTNNDIAFDYLRQFSSSELSLQSLSKSQRHLMGIQRPLPQTNEVGAQVCSAVRQTGVCDSFLEMAVTCV